MFKVTLEWLREYQTGNGGYKKSQTDALGVSWPLTKGWLRESVGKTITDQQKLIFEDGRSPENQQLF